MSSKPRDVPWFGCSVGLPFLGESVAKARTPGCSSESLSHLTLRRCRAGSPAYGDVRSPVKLWGSAHGEHLRSDTAKFPFEARRWTAAVCQARAGAPGRGRRCEPGQVHTAPLSNPTVPSKKKKQCTVAMIRKSFFFFPNDILRFLKQVLENFGLRRS